MGKKGLILIFIFFIILNIHIGAARYELGDRGQEVKQIQQYLYDIGYDVEIDGIFGHRTSEIVKNFQHNHGLKVDGIVGEETLAILEEMVKDITYIVQPGDTLSEIAVKHNITVKALKDFNQLKNDLIRIGQELKIPRTGIGGGEDGNVYTNIFHEVRPGDSLYLLARKYGVEIETIRLANNLRSDIIYVGQNLVIPHLKRDINQPFELKK
ncbi:MAG TPA: LysM peptidoglycan-binding domain-containing protein, partial [Halanaerobiales bacterium]|nr:LysM peptidoglycan-binding domain-containing protein [Halanaerobiales bacterium]